MSRIIVRALMAMILSFGVGGFAPVIAGQATGSISGTAHLGPCRADPEDYDATSAVEEPVAQNYTVVLRNAETGQIVDTTRTNAAGEYSFSGLGAATYVIEVSDEVVLVVTSSIQLGAGDMVTDIPLIVPGDCGAFLLTPLGLSLLAVAGGVGTGVIFGGPVASPSR